MTFEKYKELKLQEYKEYCYDVTMYDQIESFFIKKIIESLNPEMFIDIGFNWGGISDLISKINPNIKIIGYEPDKRNYRLSKRLYENMELYNYAVSNKNGYKKLYYCKDTTQSGLKYQIIFNKYWRIKTIKLDSVFDKIKDKNNLIIKIDTEGNEPDILYGMKKIFKKFEGSLGIIFEYSYKWLYDDKKMQQFINYIYKNGLCLFRLNLFGLESVGYNFIYEYKKYHYSILFATKGISFRDNIDMLPSQTGMKEFIPILKNTEIQIKDII